MEVPRRSWYAHYRLLLCAFLFWTAGTIAQSFEQHRWQDRVLILLAENQTDVTYRQQVLALRAEKEALEERIGVVYHVFPNAYSKGLDGRPLKERSPGPILGVRPEKGFGLLLMGLDGGVKLRSQTLVPLDSLWVLIDGMPMRRAETRRKGRNR